MNTKFLENTTYNKSNIELSISSGVDLLLNVSKQELLKIMNIPYGLTFTETERQIIYSCFKEKNGYFQDMNIEGLPDGIKFDFKSGIHTVENGIKVVDNKELYKGNPNLKEVNLNFEFYWRDVDIYLGNKPSFQKILYYLDYRN